MQFKNLRAYHSEATEEQGNAILEMALVLPFILIIVAASVDLGRALNQYISVTRVVYEATRYAASVPSLETGTVQLTDSNIPAGHAAIQQRVRVLLQSTDALDFNDITKLETTLSDNAGKLEVHVDIDFAFNALFNEFTMLNVQGSSRATGPYLFIGN